LGKLVKFQYSAATVSPEINRGNKSEYRSFLSPPTGGSRAGQALFSAQGGSASGGEGPILL